MWARVVRHRQVLPMDLLRTTGVLASDAQHVMYIAFTLSLLAAVFVGAKLSRRQRYILIAGGYRHVSDDGRLWLTCGMVSGGGAEPRGRVPRSS